MGNAAAASLARISSGVAGLDDILIGGYPRDRLYLIEGEPGTGKTTLALQFLMDGRRRGEAGLYVSLSETKEELEAGAASHGWTIDDLHVYELSVRSDGSSTDATYTLFHPSEVELDETVHAVLDEVDRVRPVRVVFDSLSEMRLLARDMLLYRRQILALKQFFIGRKATVLLLDDLTSGPTDHQLRSLAHGVIRLEQMPMEYGIERRRLTVSKVRGSEFRGGFHDYRIEPGGLVVYPRLIASEHRHPFRRELVASGVAGIDQLLGGGLDRGTSTLLIGPSGTGKSSLAAHFALAAARRGEVAAMFSFDESLDILFARLESLGIDIRQEVDAGRIVVHQPDSATLSPGELCSMVRRVVEEQKARVVVLDSLNGYLNVMPEERFLILQLRELLNFTALQGVVGILVVAQDGMVGPAMQAPVDVSYLADTVLLMRYFEALGEVRTAISVVKRRTGNHERTIREMRFGRNGIEVGPPIDEFQGVLRGTPWYIGPSKSDRGALDGPPETRIF